MKCGLILTAILTISTCLWAGNITFYADDNQDGTFTLGYSSYTGDAPVGIALVLETDAMFLSYTPVDSFFDAFIDFAHDDQAAYDPGSGPIAPPGPGFPMSSFSLCMGELNPESAPPSGGVFAIIGTGGPALVTISEDTLRGGVVDEMAAAMTTNLPMTIAVTQNPQP